MDEKQAVFEKLTLCNFKKWGVKDLKTYTIILKNKSDNMRISWVWY